MHILTLEPGKIIEYILRVSIYGAVIMATATTIVALLTHAYAPASYVPWIMWWHFDRRLQDN